VDETFNPSEFTLPDFHTVEIPIAARPGGAGTYSPAEFSREDLEMDHDILVERIVITEMERQNHVADTGASVLPLIRMRWWEDKERAYGDFLPLVAIDERRPDLSVVDAAVGAGAGYGQLVYEPKGPKELIVKDRDGIVVDWENPSVPVGGVAFPAGQVDVAVSGVLSKDDRPHSLYVPVPYLIGAVAPAGLVAGSTSPGQTSRNLTGQDLIVKRVVMAINHVDYPALGTDPRIWRHLRMMLRLSGKESDRWAPYSERAPLVAFGDRVTVNNHSVTLPFAPKKLIRRLSSIQFEFRNYSTIPTMMIATFCGLKKQPKMGQIG
jgi:hypothetical protein